MWSWKPLPELRDELRRIAAVPRHLAGEDVFPSLDQIGEFLGSPSRLVTMKESILMSSKPASMQIAAALGAQFHVHLEIGEELGDLSVGPLDAFGPRLAQAVRVLLIGDVDAAARLADAEQFLEDQFRPVEDLQRVAAGDEIELLSSRIISEASP